jgi:hypothetical protein
MTKSILMVKEAVDTQDMAESVEMAKAVMARD